MNIKNIRNLLFYLIKPIIPRSIQIFLRLRLVEYQKKKYSHIWPIDENAGNLPYGWNGWPKNKEFALVLTHDVESQNGHDKCLELMEIEKELGFVSSFNFVPERYNVSRDLRDTLVCNGFEVGVHGLNHDGKLFKTKKIFDKRAKKINYYLKKWNAFGFRAPAMHHNLEWILDLDIQYDLSTFDTDPFEPQSDGVSTIFPFFVYSNDGKRKYLELPYTLPQDSTLFIIMKEMDIKIWKNKLDWIANKGGMVLVNVHPDYLRFNSNKTVMDEYDYELYHEFLLYIKNNYSQKYWNVLPKQLTKFWTDNY